MSRMPSVGDVVDDVFRIDEELDHGNFGAVYQVEDLLEQRVLALKVLKPGPHDEDELRQRFEREARLIYSLEHPHIVKVFYYGETETELPYMAMECLQGTDLKSLLRHHGGLSEALARRITIESLSALHTAHHTDIVHRDLKPGNIYLVNDGDRGHVKVLDFGFAKALESDQNSEITNAGTLVGTPAYMSPELVHKRDVGPPADLYAMGLILAEMLTGDKVVQIESIYDTVLFQGAEDKPIELPESLRQSQFASILEKSTTKQLDRRYDTALEMIDDLRALDLPGVGTYDEDVPLETAPPEVGDADTEVRTQPRSDGRPSMEAVDASLAEQSERPPQSFSESSEMSHVADFSDDDPTVDRQYSFEVAPATGATHSGSMPGLDQSTGGSTLPQRDSSPQPKPRRHTPDSKPRAQTPNSGPPVQQRSQKPRQRVDTSPTAEPSTQSGHTPQPADSRPASRSSSPPANRARQTPDAGDTTGDTSSALRDILVGIVVGGAILVAVIGWHHFA